LHRNDLTAEGAENAEGENTEMNTGRCYRIWYHISSGSICAASKNRFFGVRASRTAQYIHIARGTIAPRVKAKLRCSLS